MADRVEFQTHEIYRATGTPAQVRRPQQPSMAVWQALASTADRKDGPHGTNRFPLGLQLAARGPHRAAGVNSTLHFINQLISAILPRLTLQSTVEQWHQIAASLAEPNRKRRPQLESLS